MDHRQLAVRHKSQNANILFGHSFFAEATRSIQIVYPFICLVRCASLCIFIRVPSCILARHAFSSQYLILISACDSRNRKKIRHNGPSIARKFHIRRKRSPKATRLGSKSTSRRYWRLRVYQSGRERERVLSFEISIRCTTNVVLLLLRNT